MVGSGWIRLKIAEQTICTTAAELFSPNLESFHEESYRCNLRENKIAMATRCSWNVLFVVLKTDIYP